MGGIGGLTGACMLATDYHCAQRDASPPRPPPSPRCTTRRLVAARRGWRLAAVRAAAGGRGQAPQRPGV